MTVAALLVGAQPPAPAPASGTWGTVVQVLSIAVPVVVALVGGVFGYRSQARQADRTGEVEGRRLTLAEYEALNRSLAAEIERLRADRREDEDRLEQRINVLETRLERLEQERRERGEAADQMQRELHRRIDRHVAWERAVLRILRTPNVAELLATGSITVPPPPPGAEDSDPTMRPARPAT